MTGATPASEFRKGREVGEVVTLPSTNRKVRMRTVKMDRLLELGDIPDVLSNLVVESLYGEMTNEKYRQFFTLVERKEHALEMTRALKIVCTAALIEPKIVDDPQADDDISIDDLEYTERRVIFDLALLEASGLSRFRQRQEEDLESMDNVEDNIFQAEPVSVGEE